jgi:hypothetical protein
MCVMSVCSVTKSSKCVSLYEARGLMAFCVPTGHSPVESWPLAGSRLATGRPISYRSRVVCSRAHALESMRPRLAAQWSGSARPPRGWPLTDPFPPIAVHWTGMGRPAADAGRRVGGAHDRRRA